MDEASTPTRSQEGTPWAMSWQDSVPIPDADSLGPECSLQPSAGPLGGQGPPVGCTGAWAPCTVREPGPRNTQGAQNRTELASLPCLEL